MLKYLSLSAYLVFAFISTGIAQNNNNNVANYYKDGLYKFQDTWKIQKSEVFSTYLSQFGFNQNNTMVMQAEGKMDEDGGESRRYVQYQNGYKVEGTMMNVISKYGIVMYVNGFSLPKLNVNTVVQIPEANALNAALNYISAPKYAWQDQDLEQSIKMTIKYQKADTTQPGDTIIDPTKTFYPKGELVIAMPYGDTGFSDTSKYRLCWKFAVNAMYMDTFSIDTNTVDTIAHYDTISQYRLHPEQIIYVDARTGNVHGLNPNVYSWTGHINHTFYHGNQNVDIHDNGSLYWLTGPHRFNWYDDGRNIGLMQGSGGSVSLATAGDNSDTWTQETGKDTYMLLERVSDYYRYNHGFWGTQQPPHAYEIGQSVWRGQSSPGEWRAGYSYNSTYNLDVYLMGSDGGSPPSAAWGDVVAHEYTHAVIRHGSNLNNYGEAGSIAEGFCDYFGTIFGWLYYGGIYTSDWTNGFGWQTGQFARHFVDPTTDYPTASSAAYGDAYWSGNKYVQSGVFRHQIVLHGWGGSFNGINVAGMAPTENDIFVTMNWWIWSSLNYHDFRNQTLAEYEYYYGACSPKWKSLIRSWAALNIGTIPYCAQFRMVNPKVIRFSDIGTVKAQFSVRRNDDQQVNPVLSYDWVLPQAWQVAYSQDHSEITLSETNDYSSKMISCIVTSLANGDTTSDTVTAFVHFVDDNNQQKGVISSNSGSNASAELEVFPNPAKNLLNVILPFQPSNEIQLNIIDLVGRNMYSSKVAQKVNLINLPSLPNGVYIVKIKGEGKELTKRITIQH